MSEMGDNPWDYTIPDIKPGSKVSFKRGDELWTHTVDSITDSTQPYVPAPRLSRRQRIIRWVTPRRWRKALPQPSGGMPVVTFKTVGHPVVTMPTTAPEGCVLAIGEKTWIARWEGPHCKCHIGNHFFWEPQQ